DWDDLARQRRQGADEHGHEGVMLKLRTSPYVPGRPKGYWFKWKRDPNMVDAVLMYASVGTASAARAIRTIRSGCGRAMRSWRSERPISALPMPNSSSSTNG